MESAEYEILEKKLAWMHQNEFLCFADETKAIRTYNYSACALLPFKALNKEDRNEILNSYFFSGERKNNAILE